MHQIILCSCPDQCTAKKIASHLIEAQLAACINILPSVTSVYLWQGKVETEQEQLLLIKSHSGQYPELERQIKALHPYELPEIIAVSIDRGLPDYLKWIDSCLVAS
ncbi:divalent-cation tolerance protein CutA [Methylomarinum sp. Ch1-1]|uniref:Divalent-cation tolerance protein CutA n=1 Tax=Methylomarinum roseum TaxID=3067653 RepID=A0AAU7NXK2_9GAMM